MKTKEMTELEQEIARLQLILENLKKNTPSIEKNTIPLEKITNKEKIAWFDALYANALGLVEESIARGFKSQELKGFKCHEAFSILNVRDVEAFYDLFNAIDDNS